MLQVIKIRRIFSLHKVKVHGAASTVTESHVVQQHGRVSYLLCGTWLPLQDGFCRLVVFVRHGTGEGCHSLAVADVQANVRVGDEELDDDAVLVADGGVDRSSALCILAKIKVVLHNFKKSRQKGYFVMGHSFSVVAPLCFTTSSIHALQELS